MMNKGMIMGMVAVLGVAFIGGAFLFMNQNRPSPATSEGIVQEQIEIVDENVEPTGDTAIGEEDENTNENPAMENVREITVEGFGFGYTPSELTLKAGEKVKLTFISKDMMHDFVIEGTDIRTEIITGGDETTIEFTAPVEPGEYIFYCSVGNHRAQGMEGTITVE